MRLWVQRATISNRITRRLSTATEHSALSLEDLSGSSVGHRLLPVKKLAAMGKISEPGKNIFALIN